ncbi:hypothetical protein ESZ50_04940 [Weissella muntiaci]|uniref:Uncharacterized protein n=1 Tax=Weissella muntiaci TaxID=2508881 RepID=A0A6C2C8N8_9LACO|nr:hypothetical protein [Weissella muntiaci]TYC49939.1 hypothetical protein ESZ50_04940 [Weissella muntiaci]
MAEASITLPDSLLSALGNEVVNQLIEVVEAKLEHYDEFVQIYASTAGKRSLVENYLGGMSGADFEYYWGERVRAEPGLTIPKGQRGGQLLYHGRKVQKFIADHAAEI